jgi:hypothetical protein
MKLIEPRGKAKTVMELTTNLIKKEINDEIERCYSFILPQILDLQHSVFKNELLNRNLKRDVRISYALS